LTDQFLLKAGAWHTLAIEFVATDRGIYDLAWAIDGRLIKRVSSEIKSFVDFALLCSMGNLDFIGDHIPRQENHALFDWAEYAAPEAGGQ